jgi:hypothetical protein
MTKSACATADIDIWTDIVKRTYEECTRWLEAALERMAIERPDLVVVGLARAKAMVDGVAVPIAKVRTGGTPPRAGPSSVSWPSPGVVVIGDTPRAQADRRSACPRTSTMRASVRCCSPTP